eukprot:scaffold137931_cov36-Tisochrysis_lutea.AAC.1
MQAHGPWAYHYVDYKALKQILKQISPDATIDNPGKSSEVCTLLRASSTRARACALLLAVARPQADVRALRGCCKCALGLAVVLSAAQSRSSRRNLLQENAGATRPSCERSSRRPLRVFSYASDPQGGFGMTACRGVEPRVRGEDGWNSSSHLAGRFDDLC